MGRALALVFALAPRRSVAVGVTARVKARAEANISRVEAVAASCDARSIRSRWRWRRDRPGIPNVRRVVGRVVVKWVGAV